MQFWGQFDVEIERSNLTSATKFSYLNKFVDPKVRILIDGVPFTSEGYNRVASILCTKYGRPSVVVSTHIQGIMQLPTINGTNPHFNENLITHVNPLATISFRTSTGKSDLLWTNWLALGKTWLEPTITCKIGNFQTDRSFKEMDQKKSC